MKSVFLLKYTLRFYLTEDVTLIFSNKSCGLQKKLFIEKNSFVSVGYVKIIGLHVIHT